MIQFAIAIFMKVQDRCALTGCMYRHAILVDIPVDQLLEIYLLPSSTLLYLW